MWIARNEDGQLVLFENKPFRVNDFWCSCEQPDYDDYGYCKTNICLFVDDDAFPGLKWEDEPIEVGLTHEEAPSRKKIIVCKNYLNIGCCCIEQRVYIELDSEDCDDSFGHEVDCEQIANDAVSQSGIFNNKEKYGMLGKYLLLDTYMSYDDEYDYESLDAMIAEHKKRVEQDPETYSQYTDIEDVVVKVPYNDKNYKVWIHFYGENIDIE